MAGRGFRSSEREDHASLAPAPLDAFPCYFTVLATLHTSLTGLKVSIKPLLMFLSLSFDFSEGASGVCDCQRKEDLPF